MGGWIVFFLNQSQHGRRRLIPTPEANRNNVGDGSYPPLPWNQCITSARMATSRREQGLAIDPEKQQDCYHLQLTFSAGGPCFVPFYMRRFVRICRPGMGTKVSRDGEALSKAQTYIYQACGAIPSFQWSATI